MRVSNVRKSLGSAVAVAALGTCLAPAPATAAVYQVTFNTTALVADSTDRSYALLLELVGGGAPGVTNTATITNFAFGGGSADGGASIDTLGYVSNNSSFAGGVTLDSQNGATSLFAQDFTPGNTLSFQISTTADLIDPTGNNNPDELSIQLLDNASSTDSFNSNNVATLAPDGVSFATLTYVDPALATATYASDPSQITAGGNSFAIPAPTLTAAVPEPGSAAFLAVTALLAVRRRKVSKP